MKKANVTRESLCSTLETKIGSYRKDIEEFKVFLERDSIYAFRDKGDAALSASIFIEVYTIAIELMFEPGKTIEELAEKAERKVVMKTLEVANDGISENVRQQYLRAYASVAYLARHGV